MAPSFFPFLTISFASSGRTGIDLLLPCRGCKHAFHSRDAFLFDLISLGTTALMEAICLAFVARWDCHSFPGNNGLALAADWFAFCAISRCSLRLP